VKLRRDADGALAVSRLASDRADATRASAHLEAHDDHSLTGLVPYDETEKTPHTAVDRIGLVVGFKDPSGDL
jgi:hypothetical protein